MWGDMVEYTALQRDYAKYRLDKSKEDLEAARVVFSQGAIELQIFIASKEETEERIANVEWVYGD